MRDPVTKDDGDLVIVDLFLIPGDSRPSRACHSFIKPELKAAIARVDALMAGKDKAVEPIDASEIPVNENILVSPKVPAQSQGMSKTGQYFWLC